MTVKVPVRTVFDGSGNATGLAEFQTGEAVGYQHGGTGIVSLGTAGQVLQVNANTDGLEWTAQGGINSISYTVANSVLTITSADGTVKTPVATDKMSVANTQTLVNARLGATASVTITGDVAGSASFSSNAVSIAVTQQNNSVDLGTHTTGNYVATISGTANEVEVSGSGSETAAVTIGLPNDVTLTGDLTVSGGDITLGGTGRIQGIDTVSAGTDAANKTYVDNAVAGVVDSAPAALDTLNELAAALGDDANFATTVSTNIGQKLGATASVTLTGDVTGSGSFSANAVSFATSIASNVVGATELNVTGNGTADQYLASDADGSFTWKDIPAGYSDSDVEAYLSGGAGISFSSGVIAVDSDQRGDITQIGQDTNDYFTVGTTTQSWFLDGAEDMRLTNNGQLDVEGSVVAHSSTVSDERLKDNIAPIEGALDIVKQLNGVSFNYKKDGKPAVGLIAQDVEKVVPSAVQETEILGHDGEYKILEYTQLIGVLVEAIKDQQKQIEELKTKVG